MVVGTIMFILGIVVSNTIAQVFTPFVHKQISQVNPLHKSVKEKIVRVPVYIYKEAGVNKTALNLLAVSSSGGGEVIPLEVEVRPGNGKILANIDNLVFWIDTQESIRIARDVAANITGRDPKTFDVVYSLKSNASIVGGPSAGAAFTIATIAALLNISLNSSVVITGTINPDGSIGPVGGILEKAEAAKEAGAKLMLVPKGEGKVVRLVPIEKCIKRPDFIFCETTYKKKLIDISKKVGIKVIEVSNIYEAMKYFFGDIKWIKKNSKI